MASYPGAIKNFTTKVDGVSPIVAADINDVQAEITAIETALAINPTTISFLASGSALNVYQSGALVGRFLALNFAGNNDFNVYSSGSTGAIYLSQSGSFVAFLDTRFVNTSGDTMTGTLNGTSFIASGSVNAATIKLTTAPTNGYVMTSDAAGNATWQAASGGGGGISSIAFYNGITSGSALAGSGSIVAFDSNFNVSVAGGKAFVSLAAGSILTAYATTQTPDSTNGTTLHNIAGLSTTFTLSSPATVSVSLGVPYLITSNTTSGSGYMDISVDGANKLGPVIVGVMPVTSVSYHSYATLIWVGALASGSHVITGQMATDAATTSIEALTASNRGVLTVQNMNTPVAGGGGAPAYILVQDQKSSGTDGGTSATGGYGTRTLNTIVSDAGGYASLSSNQVTLAAGTYTYSISAPAFEANQHQIRLMNITSGSTTVAYGTSEYARTTSIVQNRSVCQGMFTIAVPSAFEVQHQCSTSTATNGFGVAAAFSGNTEVYTVAEFWKIA